MQWITGIDLRARSNGALEMSGWLRDREPASARLVALHVVEQHARSSVRDDVLDELVASAEAALARTTAALAGGSPFATTRIVVADAAEDALAEAAASDDVLVIGRVAPREGRSPVRLGRVARRLLRRLPVPVLVVPPDLVRSTIGSGPIVVATDLEPHSLGAGRLARRLAGELGRPLVVAHVGLEARGDVVFRPGAGMPLAWPRNTVADVEAWIRAHELGPATAQLVEGDPVERLLALARDHDAPFVICGSRRLSTVERIYSSSVGVELARDADRGVLLVP